jgi:peptidoglycan/LPS O-acetylase OafA/YrhL
MTATNRPPTRPIPMTAAVLASLAAGLVYLLIGLGVVSVGTSTQDATTDLFGFGVSMAVASLAVAALLWFVPQRRILIGVVGFQLLVLIGYVLAAGLREPPFELWGLLIKACQAVVLVAAILLVTESRTAATLPKDGAA